MIKPPVNKGWLMNAVPGTDPGEGWYNGDSPADQMQANLESVDREYLAAWGRHAKPEELKAVFEFCANPVAEGRSKLNEWVEETAQLSGQPVQFILTLDKEQQRKLEQAHREYRNSGIQLGVSYTSESGGFPDPSEKGRNAWEATVKDTVSEAIWRAENLLKARQKKASAEDGKKNGDGMGVGLFIPLPDELAAQFPDLGVEDRSVPHCTFLYVGKVDKDQEERFLDVLNRTFADFKGPVRGSLYGPEYFIQPDKGRRVAVMQVRFDRDLAAFRWKLRDTLHEAGFNVDDSFPLVYRPHATLQYIPDLTTEYQGTIPSGGWSFDSIEVWGLSKLRTVQFGQALTRPKTAGSVHAKSIALMKFLSSVARHLGVARDVYIVGGAVRDFALGHAIKDLDVVIDSVSLKGKDSAWFAKELQKAIPTQTNMTINQYGVAILTVHGPWILDGQDLNGEVIEIANARQESYGQGGYKPTEVQPSGIKEDVYRRELSFNTLMWRLLDVSHGPDHAEIIDLTGCGLKDLRDGIMRCPSDPDKTLSDDPSRIIRITKFALRYGFRVPPDLEAAIRRNAQKIKNIPPNHLSNMIINLFYDKRIGKQALLEMDKLGVLDVIREIVTTDRPFRDALGNWAEKNADAQFLFDLMDLHMPVGSALSFLTAAQKSQLRENLVGFSNGDGAQDYMAYLKQPGKIVDMPRLIEVLGLQGAGIKRLTDTIRQMLLDDPALMRDPKEFERQILTRMGHTGKVAALAGVPELLVAFIAEAHTAGYEVQSLGDVEDYPIIVVYPTGRPKDQPRVLVISGTHGDEPSGVDACLKVLRDPPKSVAVSFIPLLNPIGRERGTREEAEGKDPNRGWRKGKDRGIPTPEGDIIKDNKELLADLGRDGALSIHEAREDTRFYVYDSEGGKNPGAVAYRVRDVAKQFFPEARDDEKDSFGDKIEGGIILNSNDDAFEDWMYFNVGISPVILLEVPAKASWDARVTGGAAVIRAFADFVRGQKARVVARYLQGAYFNLEDPVLFGRWKNHHGVISDFGKDEKGNPTVTVTPTPQGRKQPKTMQLFKIQHDPPPGEGPMNSIDKVTYRYASRQASIDRITARHLEAKSLREWLYWMAQPFKVIWQHHQDFVQGPIDDAVDAIIKDLAPHLVRFLVEHEVDSDVDKFIEGAKLAVQNRPMPEGGPSRDGYMWGKTHPEDVSSTNELPPFIRQQIIRDFLNDAKHRITEEVIVHLLKKSWHAINPVNTVKAIIAAVKKHGWKLGIAAALFELFEHFCLPTILVWLTGNPKFLASATLPLGEIIYAVVFAILGRTPKEIDKAEPDGHLDWFEKVYGPVRIARIR